MQRDIASIPRQTLTRGNITQNETLVNVVKVKKNIENLHCIGKR